MHRHTQLGSFSGSRFLLFGLTLFCLLAVAAPASAQFSIEGFAGYYDPDSVDGNSEIVGARIGYQPDSSNFGLLLSVGAIDLEDDLLELDDDDIQFGLFLTDLSFQWYPSGNGFYVFAGPGYAEVDLEIDFPGPDNDVDESISSFTANAGLGYRWDIGEAFFLRFEGKARWFEGDEFDADDSDSYDGLDSEYTVAAGWRF